MISSMEVLGSGATELSASLRTTQASFCLRPSLVGFCFESLTIFNPRSARLPSVLHYKMCKVCGLSRRAAELCAGLYLRPLQIDRHVVTA